MTKDDFEILKQYETQLRASLVGYIRGLYSKDVEILKDVCNRYNIKLTNKNCSSCILGAVNQLAKLYFEYEQSTNLKPIVKTKKTKNKK